MPSVPRPRLLTVCAAGALVGAVLVGRCQSAVALSDRRQGWPPRSVRLDGHGEFGEHGGESVLLGCIGGDLILAAAHVLHEPVPGGDDLGGAVSFWSADGLEPGFEPAMVTFDRVVRVLLHGVH